MYILKNDYVEIGFDEKTGAIKSLINRATGYQAIRVPALAAGLRMLIPTEAKRNHIIRGDKQELSSLRVTDGQSAVLRYDRILTPDAGSLDIAVEIKVTLKDAELTFEIVADNRSEFTIEEISYPCLGGLAEPEGEDSLVAKTPHFQGGFAFLPLADGLGNPSYWGFDMPTHYRSYPSPEVSAPFVLLENGKQGIYLGVHGIEPELFSLVVEYKPGYGDSKTRRLLRNNEIEGIHAGFCVSLTRMPFAAPGEKTALPPVVLKMYEGDWHEGVTAYSKWRDTWHTPVHRPGWLDEADCWMTLHINSPEGCRRYRYAELPGLMREAKKSGVKVLQLIGWARGGQDGDEPYQDVDPLLGTREELKEAIRQIEEMGIRVLMMCKFKWADQSTEAYGRELLPHTLKDIFGNPVYFGGYSYQTLLQALGNSRRSGAGMCHLSKGYRDIALREFQKITDLKPSGILYDELANPMLLCFDKHHGHKPGACHHVGSLTLARAFYESAMADCGEEFLFAGEGAIDVMTQVYWGSYIRSGDGGAEPTHTPLWKYLHPSYYTATCLTGFDDREMVNQCLTYGYAINYEPFNFKGMPSDAPATEAYAMKALALRAKLRDYIWNGTFRHTAGAEVTVLGAPCEHIYALFVNPLNGKRALVLANQDREARLDAKVSLEGFSGRFDVYRIDGGVEKSEDGNLRIEPRALCVLVEE